MSIVSDKVKEDLRQVKLAPSKTWSSYTPGYFAALIYFKIFSKQPKRPFLQDFHAGYWAGFISGWFVGPVQYTKVLFQTTQKQHLKQTLKSPVTFVNMMRSVLPFSALFGIVCSLQFSVNQKISDFYGTFYGIAASALTGAAFLTVADHIMLRKIYYQKKDIQTTSFGTLKELYSIKPNAIWAGFTPMIAREAIFISSVMHLGPRLGRKLHGGNQNNIMWSSIGRLITGVLTTLISQPFDSLARAIQKDLWKDPNSSSSVLKSYKAMNQQFYKARDAGLKQIHPLFKGSLPRMGLATFGGVLAGAIYDDIKKNLNKSY